MSLEESTGGPPTLPGDGEPSPLPGVKGYEEFLILSSTKQVIKN
jgi:hypothetical protein